MTISNVIGPVERMALADHPVKSLYFMVVGVPQVCHGFLKKKKNLYTDFAKTYIQNWF